MTTYAYDADGFLQSVTGPATGATTTYTYDGYGRVRTVSTPDGTGGSYTVTTDYDSLDRPTRVTYPDLTYEEMVYKRLDLEERRDRMGRWTHTFHDASRRVVATRDPAGRTIQQEWCACGSLDRLIDANGNVTSWEYDLQGRVVKEIRADGTAMQYLYEDTTSRLKQVTDRKGQVKTLAYLKDDNLQQITYVNPQNPTPNVSYTYETAYNRVATRVDKRAGVPETTTYSYYPVTAGPSYTLGANRLSSVDGPLSNDGIGYMYDELGRVTGRTVAGVGESMAIDPLGRTVVVNNTHLGIFNYTYVGTTNRLNTVTYPNAQTTTYGYYPATGDLRLQEIHNKRPNATTLSKFNYTYDAVGNITLWTEQADSNPATAYDYGYDPADQLTAATKRTTGGTPTILNQFGYAYDKAGNRTTEQVGNNPTQATYNNMNELTGQQAGGALLFRGTVNEPATVTVAGQTAGAAADNTFQAAVNVPSGTSNVVVQATDQRGNVRTNTYQVTATGTPQALIYDLNGNLCSEGGPTCTTGSKTYEWDAENRLIAVNSGTHRSEFTYDGHHRRFRIIEKESGVTTSDKRYVWCGTEICEQRDGAGTAVQRRFFRQGFQEATSKYFYARDHLGSIRDTTDNAGTLQLRLEFDPYGRANAPAGSQPPAWLTFGYTGHMQHWDSGVVLAPYRGYLSPYGRWISEDPVGLRGGMNLFAYVHNQPTVQVDPLGLQTLQECVADANEALRKCVAEADYKFRVGQRLCAIFCFTLLFRLFAFPSG